MAIRGNINGVNTPVHFGPSLTTYPQDFTFASGTPVIIHWRESGFYYIETTISPIKRGYVQEGKISGISGGTPQILPPSGSTRYIYSEAVTVIRYTPNSQSETVSGIVPGYRTSVQYINDQKVGNYAFIEYTDPSVSKRKRGWFEHAKLSVAQPTPHIYKTNQSINCDGEYWQTTVEWGSNNPDYYGHLGIDLRRYKNSAPVAANKDLFSIAAGVVKVADSTNTGGNGYCVVIEHTTTVGKRKYYSMYCHLSSLAVSNGTSVSAGQVIGVMGTTGGVTQHLHLMIRKQLMDKGTYGYNLTTDKSAKVYFNPAINPIYFDATHDGLTTRYYNPTKYFDQGDAMIDNNY